MDLRVGWFGPFAFAFAAFCGRPHNIQCQFGDRVIIRTNLSVSVIGRAGPSKTPHLLGSAEAGGSPNLQDHVPPLHLGTIEGNGMTQWYCYAVTQYEYLHPSVAPTLR
ncbi:hypothetical protein SODALDRAFT_380067 [Sodiomyces alkalinus F11]|uniref:Uncharacterized protein n=1 Tax=Sodiomyces alkalinus (strain CBS 110278 / VKM F-3762 / F11) TaxID=1314773 RepID=A0A3N2PT79_SODAK|nr:hypothetical protein SODALDRAFT_380067 [Sodiomyces alkalinus F11]ROT37624.1 hypothetical protein SODALDRAFT_380067 [Sodiomyces alkalinus F11]